MSFKIHRVVVGEWFENCYILYNNEEGWIIDPGDDFELIDAFVTDQNIALKGIINTHGHFDHLGAVTEFKEKYNIPFYLHSKDKRLVGQANLYRKLAKGKGTFRTPSIDFFLDELLKLSLGSHTIKIIHLPGHTEGSVAYCIDHDLISGDVLFENSIGRTDLPGGNLATLKQSVDTLLREFAGFTIHPGHGNSFILTNKHTTMTISNY